MPEVLRPLSVEFAAPVASLLTSTEYEDLGSLPPSSPSKLKALETALLTATGWCERATGRLLVPGTDDDPRSFASLWDGPLSGTVNLGLPVAFFAEASVLTVIDADGGATVLTVTDHLIEPQSGDPPRVVRLKGLEAPSGSRLRMDWTGRVADVGDALPLAVSKGAKAVVAAFARGILEFGPSGVGWNPNTAERALLKSLRLPMPEWI